MKLSIIASIVSGAGIAAAAAVAAPSSATCVAYDGAYPQSPFLDEANYRAAGVCFLNGVDYGACCDDGICAGSRCRDPKTLTAEPTATPEPTCVPYNGMHLVHFFV